MQDVAKQYGFYGYGAAYSSTRPVTESGQVLYDLCLEAGIIDFCDVKNTARVSDTFHRWMLYDCLVSAKSICGTGNMWQLCSDWLQHPEEPLLKTIQELFVINSRRLNIETDFGRNIESCLGQHCIRLGKGVARNSVLFTTQSAIPFWVRCHELDSYDPEGSHEQSLMLEQAKLRARLYRTFEQRGMLPAAVPSP